MIHPRDHVLCLQGQLRSDMTDVSKVSVKVRVNGGAPTTYTSVSAPAVAQAQDCSFAYHLELPAGSFADGDRVSRTWIYNGVAYAYGDTIIGPAAADETVLAAIKAKTDLLGVAAVATTSPVSPTGTVKIVAGDDYAVADGRALQWIDSWPSLAGATISVQVTIGLVEHDFAGSASVAGSDQLVTVPLTAAQTGALTVGRYTYTLIAVLAGTGRTLTLATGPITVA